MTRKSNRRHTLRRSNRRRRTSPKKTAAAKKTTTTFDPAVVNPASIQTQEPQVTTQVTKSQEPQNTQESQTKNNFDLLFTNEIVPILTAAKVDSLKIKQTIDDAVLKTESPTESFTAVYRDGLEAVKQLFQKQPSEVTESKVIQLALAPIKQKKD